MTFFNFTFPKLFNIFCLKQVQSSKVKQLNMKMPLTKPIHCLECNLQPSDKIKWKYGLQKLHEYQPACIIKIFSNLTNF